MRDAGHRDVLVLDLVQVTRVGSAGCTLILHFHKTHMLEYQQKLIHKNGEPLALGCADANVLVRRPLRG